MGLEATKSTLNSYKTVSGKIFWSFGNIGEDQVDLSRGRGGNYLGSQAKMCIGFSVCKMKTLPLLNVMQYAIVSPFNSKILKSYRKSTYCYNRAQSVLNPD